MTERAVMRDLGDDLYEITDRSLGQPQIVAGRIHAEQRVDYLNGAVFGTIPTAEGEVHFRAELEIS